MRKKNAQTGAAETAAAGTPADPVSRFEGALTELEGIVAKMERGDLPLEESLALFERGVALGKECRGALETAELRVRTLLESERDPLPDDAG